MCTQTHICAHRYTHVLFCVHVSVCVTPISLSPYCVSAFVYGSFHSVSLLYLNVSIYVSLLSPFSVLSPSLFYLISLSVFLLCLPLSHA